MFKDPLRILKVYKETISDGEGLRYSIYLSGCHHRCQACHNALSRNSELGDLITAEIVDQMVSEINGNSLLDGVTFSGGDPFFYPKSFVELVRLIKERTQKNIWCYTGYTYEEVLARADLSACLTYIDVLVDGRFEEEKYQPDLAFRGSYNQRIIKLEKKLEEVISF